MCGFTFVTGPKARHRSVTEAGLEALKHRGPDGRGVWVAPDGCVALGHVRLAILDLSPAGAQPMMSSDGRAAIAYNGEIYNYRELVGQVNVELRSHSDTEVLVELLRKKGAHAITQLRGMFAFAYWDGEEALLVRDRVGIKPLFYAEQDGELAAASEIAALLSMGFGSKDIDLRAIDDYLTYHYVPAPRTGLRGIKQLPPGHLLRWRRGKPAEIQRYWQAPLSVASSVPSAEEVRSIVEDAVRCHLVSDVPVGVFLSGGLDSSSIVALAARHYAGCLKTFSVTFGNEGKRLDERAYASQVAQRYGTEHTEIEVRANAAEILPDLVAHFGQPFGNPTATLSYALSRETRKHVSVALAGDGGDEVLGGYPRYLGVWLAELYGRAPRAARNGFEQALRCALPKSTEFGSMSSWAKRFIATAGSSDPETMYFRWLTFADAARKEALWLDRDHSLASEMPTHPYEFVRASTTDRPSMRMRDAAALVDIESFLPQNVLTYGDRMSMAHSLEVRVPFCDHVVIERLGAMPLSAKMPGGVQKGIFRWAMRNDLPRGVVLHKKIGFNPPIAQWFNQDLRPLLSDYLGDAAVRRRGLFRPDAVAKLREEFERGHPESAHPLWALVVLEAWCRWVGSL